MSSLKASALFLLPAPVLAAALTAQGGPPKVHPYIPPTDCFKQVILRAPYDNVFVRRLVGDKWLSGCMGAQGPCEVVIWVPC